MAGIETAPWVRWFFSDWRFGTGHLTVAAKGTYHELLAYQWDKGQLPDDLEVLGRWVGTNDHELIAGVIAEFFPGGWNSRLERERENTLVTIAANAKRNEGMREGKRRKREERLRHEDHDDARDDDHDEDRDDSTSVTALQPQPQPQPHLQEQPEQQSQPAIQKAPTLVSDQMWGTFKALYPSRRGNQYWAKARIHAEKLLKANVEWSDIMAGVRRYRTQAEAFGVVGTEKVKQAQFWLAPKEQLWTEEFPLKAHSEKTSRNVANLNAALANHEARK